MSGLGKYAKLIAAVLGAVATVLTQVYGSSNHWALLATSAATVVAVYLVPNTQPPAKP